VRAITEPPEAGDRARDGEIGSAVPVCLEAKREGTLDLSRKCCMAVMKIE